MDTLPVVVVVPLPPLLELPVIVAVKDALLPLVSAALAVIVAVPAETPVTVPLELTVATLVLLLDQVTFLLVAFVGATVAVTALVDPAAREKFPVLKVIPVTSTVDGVEGVDGVVVVPPPLVLLRRSITTSYNLMPPLQPNWTVTLVFWLCV